MSRPKSLTRRQRAVIEDLFADKADEQKVLDKHRVRRALYSRWLTDERFNAELDRRLAQAYRAGRLALARAASQAADTLITLAQGKPGETTRKACLDILAAQAPTASTPAAPQPTPPVAATPLPPETASRILALLAEAHSDSTSGTRRH